MVLNCGVGEDSWESLPLDCKENQPVHPKGNQSWIFIWRTDAEAEVPIFWPPDEKNWLIGKDPDAGNDWRQEKKGNTEDEIVRWHYWLDEHEFEQALGVGDGQGGLACCSPWCLKESYTTEWLNWLNIQDSFAHGALLGRLFITVPILMCVYMTEAKLVQQCFLGFTLLAPSKTRYQWDMGYKYIPVLYSYTVYDCIFSYRF